MRNVIVVAAMKVGIDTATRRRTCRATIVSWNVPPDADMIPTGGLEESGSTDPNPDVAWSAPPAQRLTGCHEPLNQLEGDLDGTTSPQIHDQQRAHGRLPPRMDGGYLPLRLK